MDIMFVRYTMVRNGKRFNILYSNRYLFSKRKICEFISAQKKMEICITLCTKIDTKMFISKTTFFFYQMLATCYPRQSFF
jgi:hypothetical protein